MKERVGFGDSGENEGKLVRDLSEAAIELAELDTWEARRLERRRTVVERLLLLIDAVLCWDAERSSGKGGFASTSMAGSDADGVGDGTRGACAQSWPRPVDRVR